MLLSLQDWRIHVDQMHQHKSGIESALKETKVCELIQMSLWVHLFICEAPVKGKHERKMAQSLPLRSLLIKYTILYLNSPKI